MAQLIQDLINAKTATSLPNSNSQKEQIKTAIRQLKAIKDPSILQNMVLQNPGIRPAMDFIRSMGSPSQALFSLAQQKGFTQAEILELFR